MFKTLYIIRLEKQKIFSKKIKSLYLYLLLQIILLLLSKIKSNIINFFGIKKFNSSIYKNVLAFT